LRNISRLKEIPQFPNHFFSTQCKKGMVVTMTNSRSIEQSARDKVASFWWMPLIRGILLILFGILMYVSPGVTLLSLIWYLGIYWIVDGVFWLVQAFSGAQFSSMWGNSRWWLIIGGILSIIAGVITLGHPFLAGLVNGSFGLSNRHQHLVAGVSMLISGRDGSRTFWSVLVGVLYIILGY
jgi:uncharacterized membrane protein HdeD (DUF308 family)